MDTLPVYPFQFGKHVSKRDRVEFHAVGVVVAQQPNGQGLRYLQPSSLTSKENKLGSELTYKESTKGCIRVY